MGKKGRRHHVKGGNVEGRRHEGAGIDGGNTRMYERDSVARKDDRKRAVMEAYRNVRRVVTVKVKVTSIESEGRRPRRDGKALGQTVL